jgi:hypothetical protein
MRRFPPGFLSLSASVACERFGFFLLASLLLLYLNERLGFTTAQATEVLGCFVAATYVSPLLAGAMTDGRLGVVRAAALGYLVAAVGYALLAAESRPTLYVGLTLVALGAGAAKLAPQSLATRLFAAEPELRDRGLILMYLLANVSALVSPVIGETARAWLGWPAAFALASLSLVVCEPHHSDAVARPAGHRKKNRGPRRVRPNPRQRFPRHAVRTLRAVGSVHHSADAGEQHVAFVDARQHQPPPAWLGASGSLCRVAACRSGLGRLAAARSRSASLKTTPGLPTAAAKIALGMLATGLAYVPLLVAAVRLPDGSLAGLGWLFVCLSLLSVGELLVGALGPSFVLRIAPSTRGGRWLGVWYVATAVGFWLAGQARRTVGQSAAQSVLPRDSGGADAWTPSDPLHAAVSESVGVSSRVPPFLLLPQPHDAVDQPESEQRHPRHPQRVFRRAVLPL